MGSKHKTVEGCTPVMPRFQVGGYVSEQFLSQYAQTITRDCTTTRPQYKSCFANSMQGSVVTDGERKKECVYDGIQGRQQEQFNNKSYNKAGYYETNSNQNNLAVSTFDGRQICQYKLPVMTSMSNICKVETVISLPCYDQQVTQLEREEQNNRVRKQIDQLSRQLEKV